MGHNLVLKIFGRYVRLTQLRCHSTKFHAMDFTVVVTLSVCVLCQEREVSVWKVVLR